MSRYALAATDFNIRNFLFFFDDMSQHTIVSLSQNWERVGVSVHDTGSVIITPHPSLLPSRGEGAKTSRPPKGVGFQIPY